MPLSADPSDTIAYVLLTDRLKPAEQQAKFHFYFLSSKDSRQVDRLHQQAVDAENAEDVDASAAAGVEILNLGLAGWTNVLYRGKPVEFTPDAKLDTFLTFSELWELVGAVIKETRLTEIHRKNSALPAPSAPASSAPTAEEAAA